MGVLGDLDLRRWLNRGGEAQTRGVWIALGLLIVFGLMRYDGFPGSPDIQTDLERAIKGWGLERDTLNTRCREIWASGWRPGQDAGDSVGSGADVEDTGS